jgi:hypothetical protein
MPVMTNRKLFDGVRSVLSNSISKGSNDAPRRTDLEVSDVGLGADEAR